MIGVPLCDGSASTLESWDLVEAFLSVEQIENIQRSCRRIKRTSIMWVHDPQSAVSILLVSYGSQLEWAYLYRFREFDLKYVT